MWEEGKRTLRKELKKKKEGRKELREEPKREEGLRQIVGSRCLRRLEWRIVGMGIDGAE